MAWVDAQNALTRSYLDGPRREAIKARLTELLDYPRVSVPEKQGTRYFFTRNSGLQNQSVLYVREGLAGAERILIDPNALSPDGTVALTGTAPTQDGALLGYSLSRSGSDRQEILRPRRGHGQGPARPVLGEVHRHHLDAGQAGFYYTRFPQPGTVPAGDENYFAKVYYHRLGDAQEKDALVFETPGPEGGDLAAPSLTLDGRYLVLTGERGLERQERGLGRGPQAADGKPALLVQGLRRTRMRYVGERTGASSS